jgi:hypothetical protein
MSKPIGLLTSIIVTLACPSGVFSSISSGSGFEPAKPFTANLWLGGATASKRAIYPDNDFVDFTQTVLATTDVPNTATATVEFSDYNNPGHVPYSVSARAQTKTLPGAGKSINYTFRLTTNGNDTKTGTITLEFKLAAVTGATAVEPLTQQVMITVQARGTAPR